MSKIQKMALMFMTSFIGTALILMSFVMYVINGSMLERVVEKSDYAVLIHEEVLESVDQTLVNYGLSNSILDDVFTLDRIRTNIDHNLTGLDPLVVDDEVLVALHDEIERKRITFTGDVEKGMFELKDVVVSVFIGRTRFPLQGTIVELLKKVVPYIWGLLVVIALMFGVFVKRLNALSKQLQVTVFLSIIGTWFAILVILSIMNIELLIIEPVSTRNLVIAFHKTVLVNGFLFMILIIVIFGTSLFFNFRRNQKKIS